MLRVSKIKLGTADEEPRSTALHSPVLCVTTATSFHVVFTGSNCSDRIFQRISFSDRWNPGCSRARIIHTASITELGSDLSVHIVAMSEVRPQANSMLTSFECIISSTVCKEKEALMLRKTEQFSEGLRTWKGQR